MSWHLNIPKKLHVYWAGGSLPYLRYLTIKSFAKFNPDWEINLWTSQFKSQVRTWNSSELNYESSWDDYTDKLLRSVDYTHAIDFNNFGMSNDISEVHKSDYLRFFIMERDGGVYADTDILFFKPIDELLVNIPQNADKDTFVCISHYGHSNGFFMANKGSRFFKLMQTFSIRELRTDGYQSNGVNACNKYFPSVESIRRVSPVANIGMEAVYAHDGQHIKDIYNGTKPRFTDGSIGCHWYAGAKQAGEFLRNTNGGVDNIPDNIIGNLIKHVEDI